MRKLSVVFSVIASTIAANPAMANEARLELRGGVAWANGASDESVGVALGYDADVGENIFVGAEAVADTNFDFEDVLLGVNARVGTKVSENGKIFATAGYARETEFDIDDAVIGVGYQHNLGQKSFVSAQYQRYLDLDINRISLGIGFRF